MMNVAERISALNPEQRALFEVKLKRQRQVAPQIQVIPRRNLQTAPLSYEQERLWFIHELDPLSASYNILCSPMYLKGPLDVSALERSLNEIVHRHEVLRSTIVTLDGQPVQVIAPELTVALPIVDLTDLPATERRAAAARFAREYVLEPFDLAHGPLLRVALIRLGESEHALVVLIHHVATDWWSIGLFTRELGIHYQCSLTGEPSSLPELPIQYADYASWQREWLQGDAQEKLLSYWKQQLAGAPHVLQLPTDRPRPAIQSSRGAQEPLALPRSLSQAIHALGRREDATPFMTLLAAFKTLLFRYTGQADIIIGSPVANRHRMETQGMIGMLLNTLALRTEFTDNPSFRELLRREREAILGAYEHQELPFGKVVELLQPERDLSRTPIVQVAFVYLVDEGGDGPAPDFSGLTLEPFAFEPGVSRFDITLALWDRPQGFSGWFEYNTDLYDRTTMTRMAGHFQTLLEGIVARPEQRLSNLPLLTPAEQQQLLPWQQPRPSFAPEQLPHELFETQVRLRPEAVALSYQQAKLSYRELNERANQLAHHLQGLGVGPEIRVALLLERSVDLVIALLAVLKAGGAYVPIDLSYPAERLSFMLKDSGSTILLTHAELAKKLPENDVRVICLDSDWEPISQGSTENLTGGPAADNLAYVIYTSGSTGKPRGVLVSHANVARLFSATRSWFNFRQKDVWTLFHSPAFDFSVWELWGALLHGGRLVIVPHWVSRTPEAFYDLLCTEQVTVLNQTPSAFRQLTRPMLTVGVKELALRFIIFGGETLDLQSLKPWVDHYGDTAPKLINMYGITETTVHVTYGPVTMRDVMETSGSVIGRCLPDLQLYLLDQHLQPVPVGIPGEMYITGAGMARGYLDRPDLTAERFIPNPFNEAGTRMYKTGDLARHLPNGDLEYLGRTDHQLKIKGFRIEAGEIESVLNGYDAVQESVVMMWEDALGEKRLVAYVVATEEQELTVRQLRSHLEEELPDYMIPAAFVLLDRLPLTINGKVDKRALPPPSSTRPELVESFVAPRSPVEEMLTGIWAEVLGVEQIGVHDNFFELGGDSILSIQIVARASQAGLQLTPRQLFKHQSVAALAAVISSTDAPVAAEQGLIGGSVPLTPIQAHFFAQPLRQRDHYNQSVLLEVTAGANAKWLEEAVTNLLAQHDALRMRFVQSASGWQQQNLTAEEQPVFAVCDLSGMAVAEQAGSLEAEAENVQRSLRLTDGPLVRFLYFELGAGRSGRLLLVIHHLVVDGVGWRILLADLERGYHQLAAGQQVALGRKSSSFKQWAERLHEYATSEELAEQVPYWREQCAAPVPGLMLDCSAAELEARNTVGDSEQVEISLSTEQTRALLTEVGAAYHAQIQEVLLAALALGYARWSGEGQLRVDVEGHGREQEQVGAVDVSRTVGWFTTVYPVLLEVETGDSSAAAVKRVKERLRTVPGEGLGYGVLRWLSKEADVSKALSDNGHRRGSEMRSAEISFNYLGQLDQVFAGSELWAGVGQERSGWGRSAEERRDYVLDVGGSVVNGRLQLQLVYGGRVLRRERMEQLGRQVQAVLEELIDERTSPEAGILTPSDFPEAKLSQEELDQLVAQLAGFDQ